MKGLAQLTCAGVLLLAALPARAQVSAGDAALAERLFDDGRQLMAKKNFAEACPKLAESQRLDPGVGTLLNLAECYDRSGKTASAWATYKEAESAATREGQKKRASFAGARAHALEPGLAYLVFEAPDGAQVTCDGKALGAATLGTPLPFDPGKHHAEATARGRLPWTKDVELAAHATLRVQVELAAAPAAPEPVAAPLPPPPPPAPRTGIRPLRVAGVVAGGVGLVGVGVGSFFGLRAKSTNDDAGPHCGPATCDEAGARLTSDAKHDATVSTVLFAVGATALVAGVVLWFVAPRSPATSAALGRLVF